MNKQGQTVHKLQTATFWDIYSISPLIYTDVQIYTDIYLHDLLLNFLTTFSLRMLCLKKPYNMPFLKKFKTKILIFKYFTKKPL